MARIAGVNIPTNKRVVIALQYIHGIGPTKARQIIETALAESGGRVYGSNGAAAKLRVPPSALDSKIKKLKIRKNHFKLC